MKKLLLATTGLLLAGCITTPQEVCFRDIETLDEIHLSDETCQLVTGSLSVRNGGDKDPLTPKPVDDENGPDTNDNTDDNGPGTKEENPQENDNGDGSSESNDSNGSHSQNSDDSNGDSSD